MATDPLRVNRNTDLQKVARDVQFTRESLNLGGARVRISARNVNPAVYRTYPFRSLTTTYALLPSPGDTGAGSRAVITDVTDDEAAVGWNGTVTIGGGANTLPVWSDGIDWRLG